MFLAFILLIIVAFCGAQFAPPGRLHTDYCSKATTTAVNGIFVVMVFFRHLNTYLQVSAADPLQKQWVTVNGFLGQLIVVSFLFYSGYGIFCSIEKKGTPYVRRMFPHHFLRLFVHFDVCVLLFALVNVLLHRPMSGKDLLLALTTYTSIGNSNWYITAVLLLYICTMVAFLCFRRHPLPALVLVTVLCIGCVFGQIKLHRPGYCYNTMIVFPLGMWYRYLQPKIDALLQRSGFVYSLAVCGVLFFVGLCVRRPFGAADHEDQTRQQCADFPGQPCVLHLYFAAYTYDGAQSVRFCCQAAAIFGAQFCLYRGDRVAV